ncbi:MAG: DUF3891 family protein [Planctomycetia bacterium]|nr:DUF3891 family protein [Planctomycetia bacterium]
MIRRIERAGGKENWLLVPQIDHARVSGRLAEAWTDASLVAIEPPGELAKAITHHDDGWDQWDAAPDVDPAAGHPLSFTEMPLPTAVAIWERSIRRAAEFGSLAAHVVSAHFTALLQAASPRWSADPLQFQTSRRFLDEQSDLREKWFADWQKVNPAERTRKVAGRALAYLQFFDALSLWLCCAPRFEPQSMQTPEGYYLSLGPMADNRFSVQPWPLSVERVRARIHARRIPVGRYASRAELAAAGGQQIELDFELIPAT